MTGATGDIQPFAINISDEALTDLAERLARTRWPERETPEDWSQGIPLAYLQEVVAYWRDGYDWRAREALLNRWDGYVTPIDGLDVHFLHIPSSEPSAVPLVMTHGWPGSIVEFQKVIGPLTDPAAHGGDSADAFHLVCPSLPGYAFSGKPSEPGWNVQRIARAWNELMVRLGYDRYFAQGGDWGSLVTAQIGMQNLGNCQAIHLNMALAPPDPETMDDLTEQEQGALAAMQFYQEHDSGYSKQQSTRPQTLGYGLADSPVGQAGWILEKFYFWTDCDGHPENVLNRDELLDNVMLYWLTNSAASSARLYWESFGSGNTNDPVEMPVGISVFPKEIFRTSERWARKRYSNLAHFNVLEKGGHFAAFEQPETFVDEVRTCFRGLRGGGA
jgi:pimeloyl-ACP methyl ester carboxylesterase